jgi:hypothetical protein
MSPPDLFAIKLYLLHAGLLLGLFFEPDGGGGNMFLRNVNELYGIISQKIELFLLFMVL